MSWQPLLEGEWKDRAWESIRAIRNELSRLDGAAIGPSLAGGATGLAVLHGYLAQAEGGPEHAAAAVRHLRGATADAAGSPTEASLYSGLTGVGWALAHLQGRLAQLDGEDDLAEIDEALREHLDKSPWREDYDLISGLVGFGVYALERLPRPAALSCLQRVIDRLAETAEQTAEGITWWTKPAWLPAETRAKWPHGYYNLGLAHGVPGVIAILGLACATDVAVAKARPLLEGAVRWLLAQQVAGGFPAWVRGPGAEDTPARLAWCYGDPGAAAALLGAARCLEEPAWECEALAIARRAAERPPEQAGVVDAGLCHGAAGLGHLFNRLVQATGDPKLGDAAQFWLRRTLAMRHPGRGIAGFAAWMPKTNEDKDGWVDEPGLLTGAAGIALALLAAVTPIEPAWDRLLLVRIPPRPTA
jgi:lantibiotic modifying enzyme